MHLCALNSAPYRVRLCICLCMNNAVGYAILYSYPVR